MMIAFVSEIAMWDCELKHGWEREGEIRVIYWLILNDWFGCVSNCMRRWVRKYISEKGWWRIEWIEVSRRINDWLNEGRNNDVCFRLGGKPCSSLSESVTGDWMRHQVNIIGILPDCMGLYAPEKEVISDSTRALCGKDVIDECVHFSWISVLLFNSVRKATFFTNTLLCHCNHKSPSVISRSFVVVFLFFPSAWM